MASFAINDLDIVCISNGDHAFKFMKQYDTLAVDTDLNMLNSRLQGEQLLKHVAYFNFTHVPQNMAIHSADPVSIDGGSFIKKADGEAFTNYIQQVLLPEIPASNSLLS